MDGDCWYGPLVRCPPRSSVHTPDTGTVVCLGVSSSHASCIYWNTIDERKVKNKWKTVKNEKRNKKARRKKWEKIETRQSLNIFYVIFSHKNLIFDVTYRLHISLYHCMSNITRGSVVQWVARLTHDLCIPVSHEFKPHQRTPLFPWARNFTLIA